MNGASDTKVCPLCAETIKAAAKVCPHCQSRQGRFAILKGEIAGTLVLLALLAIVAFLLDRIFSDESDWNLYTGFALHRQDLQVVRTALGPGPRQSEYWLMGYVTNRGERPWRVHELEVRLQDPQGHLVDVRHPELGKEEAFVVQPGQEHAFRVTLDTLTRTNALNVSNVRVQIASDGRQRYDPS